MSLQGRIAKWVTETLGFRSMSKSERALRLLEETVEFAQAVGVPAIQATEVVRYVYSRPLGDPAQEIGGVSIALNAAASSVGVDLESQTEKELARIETPEIREKARRRDVEKADAGVGTLGG